jgi:hypothetical protein
MIFKLIFSFYCAALLSLLVMADTRGWLLMNFGKGGMGRSYRAFGHK